MGPDRLIVGVWQGAAVSDMVLRGSFFEDMTFPRDLNDEKRLPFDDLEEVGATVNAKVQRQARDWPVHRLERRPDRLTPSGQGGMV